MNAVRDCSEPLATSSVLSVVCCVIRFLIEIPARFSHRLPDCDCDMKKAPLLAGLTADCVCYKPRLPRWRDRAVMMPNQSANEDGIIIRPDTTASAFVCIATVIPYILANLPSVSKSYLIGPLDPNHSET